MNLKVKLAIVCVLAASSMAVANIRHTIFNYFHWLYIDFGTTPGSGHGVYDTDSGAKYVEVALNGNSCYDIHVEAQTTSNPDLIFRIMTSGGTEETVDDDGPGHYQPRALFWITAPTILKVRAYSSSNNSADFGIYSYIYTSITNATDCSNVDTSRPYFNGATGVIVRGPNGSYD
jgi:hypothetical protein